MDAAAFLYHLVSLPDYRQQAVHIERIPPQGAIFGKLANTLHPSIPASLASLGKSSLDRRQA